MSEPKFQIKDWVRCTEHNVEFQVECADIYECDKFLGRGGNYSYSNKSELTLHSCCGDNMHLDKNGTRSTAVPEHLLEAVTDFRVGDVVECISGCVELNHGERNTVNKTDRLHLYIGVTSYGTIDYGFFKTRFKLISRGASHMSKKEELKRRIDKVEGWDKGTDDLINDITELDNLTHLRIEIKWFCSIQNNIQVDFCFDCGKDILRTFPYDSQCSKNAAFKSALLWLLNHSKHCDNTAEIAKLKSQGKKLTADVEEINAQIRKLEG